MIAAVRLLLLATALVLLVTLLYVGASAAARLTHREWLHRAGPFEVELRDIGENYRQRPPRKPTEHKADHTSRQLIAALEQRDRTIDQLRPSSPTFSRSAKEAVLTIPDADRILSPDDTLRLSRVKEAVEPLTEADLEQIRREVAEDAILIRECREALARREEEWRREQAIYQRGLIALRNLHARLGVPFPIDLQRLLQD